jgi:hypothetical protein
VFPAGAVIGALLAARGATGGPTKARLFGRRYVAQAPPAARVVAYAVPWSMTLTGALTAGTLSTKDPGGAVLGVLIFGILIMPFSIGALGRHFLFDDEGIEVISAWRRRRFLRYREIVRVRRTIGEGYVLRTSKGVRIHVPDNLSGGLTLAAKIAKHMPEGASVTRAARAKLAACAASEAE